MKKLSLSKALDKIKWQIPFEALVDEGSFYVKVEAYVPVICFAIHQGHRFSSELQTKCVLSDYDRWYEEDPHTLNFIAGQPIVLAGCDSRYAYDLNRSPREAIYDTAWGKKVWHTPLSEIEKSNSLKKHRAFYLLVDVLLQQLSKRFLNLVVFDMHSFNFRRMPNPAPDFNLGTVLIKQAAFRPQVEQWLMMLRKIALPELSLRVAENEVFVGDGYLAEYINSTYSQVLVLVTEIKKIYVNELTGETYEAVISSLAKQFNRLIGQFTPDKAGHC
ncbi:MAG: N-formylglutamate amidohydrolase [Salinivirgaceae bacterium]